MNVLEIENYFLALQLKICQQIEQIDGTNFKLDHWQKGDDKGYGQTHVLENGKVFEQAGVNFSHIKGKNMPASATANRPELTGRDFQAMGVSLVIHPNNPFVPTVHMNVRFFIATAKDKDPIWWFGGGYDLTPYYGFESDCYAWHKNASQACEAFGDGVYAKYKTWCDEYFYLKHRDEARGIGGLFFDDLNSKDFDACFELTKSIGNSFLTGYLPIVATRKDTPWTEKNRNWQLYRRGRYVEFNLIYDRGTLFGLQSGGRTDSILMSLPPLVKWGYQHQPQENSPEERLYTEFLPIKDWLNESN